MNPTHSKKRYREFEVDPSIWDKERPLGVSGILRCQNSADFLEACVESCIDGLDELIAVYHNCTDETVPILNRLLEKYPDKIRIYEYLPYVYPIDLADEQFSETLNLPLDSVHLLSGYTNFAISKAKYRYAIKIDSDQIFFKKQFKEWCDAYRSQETVRIYWLEDWAFKFYEHYVKNFKNSSSFYRRILNLLATYLSNFYFSYLRKRVIRDKVLVSLSGINLFRNAGKWLIALGDEDIDTTYRDILCPFNGVRDLFFFKVSSEMTYKACYLPKKPGYNQVLEVMFHNQKLFDGGLIWFHMRPCLQKHREIYQYWYNQVPNRFLDFMIFKSFSYAKLKRKYDVFIHQRMEGIFSYLYTSMRLNIPWNILLDMNRFDLGKYRCDFKKDIKNISGEFKYNLQKIILDYLNSIENINNKLLYFGHDDIKKSLFLYLFTFANHEKYAYCMARISGLNENKSLLNVCNYLRHFELECSMLKNSCKIDNLMFNKHPWADILKGYRGCQLFYVEDEQEFKSMLSSILNSKTNIFLLAEYEVVEEIEVFADVVVVKVEFSDIIVYENYFLERNFPYFFKYANMFKILLEILKPIKVCCCWNKKTYKKELLRSLMMRKY